MQFYLNGFRAGDPDRSDQSSSAAVNVSSNDLPEKVDVLIAGCGPAGLCLAAQLAAFPEIATMIVEPKAGPLEKGQADGINVRSMEMFQTFGFADKMKREAMWINETTFWQPDPQMPDNIRRVGRVQDVEDGLSEMPHVLNNQARVHDMFLDIMRNSAMRLEPDYCLRVANVVLNEDDQDYPAIVTLARTDPGRAGEMETVKARYVVGCDGARSTVRDAIGGKLRGDAAHQAWGVMDILASSNFPDIRMKSIIQSRSDGNILVLPREGGYLVRLYVELDQLNVSERVSDRNLKLEDIIERAQRILRPFTLDVKEVVWWSIYEIGHRLTDKFDDVPRDVGSDYFPRIFTAGDACHTHSPKAGQGMNVSMGDTFNLGWKLISVLTERARKNLLHSYSFERREAARSLIEYDHKWSRIVTKSPLENDFSDEMSLVQRKFIEGGRFTAGLTVKYEASPITGLATWQHLARGFEIGMRFHSAPVMRVSDAKPTQLGHVIQAGIRWTIFLFAGRNHSSLNNFCEYFVSDHRSPLLRFRRDNDDPDSLIDLRAIFQETYRDVAINSAHRALCPKKGCYSLTDYEKVFCACSDDQNDIFDLRRIDRESGCMVIVRPDQHVANVLRLTDQEALSAFFAGIFVDSA